MNISISLSSEQPIYEQIYNDIVAQIINGSLVAGYKFLPIRTVAKELGVSVITIKKAWEMLERNGFINTVVGRGCFVAEYDATEMSRRKDSLIIEKLNNDLVYYRQLGLTYDELKDYIQKLY